MRGQTRPGSGGAAIAAVIAAAGISIYDSLDDRRELFYDIRTLEERLREELRGLRLGYPIRTRAKVAKEAVCRALGYEPPVQFLRTRPRFPGQDLDVYVQKANNLQVWNEEISPTRRYAILRLNQSDEFVDVRVVTGETLAALDATGTLTSKYQAKRRSGRSGSVLVSQSDTGNFRRLLNPVSALDGGSLRRLSPAVPPIPGLVLTVGDVYARLSDLVGQEIVDPGVGQERARGEVAQRLAAGALGLGPHVNRGHWPDVLCQALEVKLQASPTIDLGLVAPDSEAPAPEVGQGIRHRDIRYAVFYADRLGRADLVIRSLVVATGQDFFVEFQRFEGQVQNRKIQIPLPATFFGHPE